MRKFIGGVLMNMALLAAMLGFPELGREHNHDATTASARGQGGESGYA